MTNTQTSAASQTPREAKGVVEAGLISYRNVD